MKTYSNDFRTGQQAEFGRVFKRLLKKTSWFLKMLLVRGDRKVRKCCWELSYSGRKLATVSPMVTWRVKNIPILWFLFRMHKSFTFY